MNRHELLHNRLVRRAENTAVIARYLAFFLYFPMAMTGHAPSEAWQLTTVTAVVVGHNLFAHWAASAEREKWFRTPVNLLFHLADACSIAWIAGSGSALGFALFPLIVLGFGAYATNTKHVWLVSFLVCVCHAFISWLRSRTLGGYLTWHAELGQCFFILGVGWLAVCLCQLLRQLHRHADSQARTIESIHKTLIAAIQGVSDPVLIFDTREWITDANLPACHMVGMDINQLIGQRIRAFLFDDGSLASRLASACSTGNYEGDEVVISSTEGKEHHVRMRICEYLQGQEAYYVAILKDITAETQAYEARQLASADLRRLRQELEDVAGLRERFLMVMSRQVRSPLSAILGLLDMLIHEELGEVSPDQLKAMQTCRRSALRILRALDDASGPPPSSEHVFEHSVGSWPPLNDIENSQAD